jgi:hypothetical protein
VPGARIVLNRGTYLPVLSTLVFGVHLPGTSCRTLAWASFPSHPRPLSLLGSLCVSRYRPSFVGRSRLQDLGFPRPIPTFPTSQLPFPLTPFTLRSFLTLNSFIQHQQSLSEWLTGSFSHYHYEYQLRVLHSKVTITSVCFAQPTFFISTYL